MKKEDRVGYVNPKSIDLDLAYRMSKGWTFSFDEPPEHLTAASSVYIGFQMGKCAGARGFFLCLKQLSEAARLRTERIFGSTENIFRSHGVSGTTRKVK